MKMKVQELRNLISLADRELLEKVFVESYKQFSKLQKDEVDNLIYGILEGKNVKQKTRVKQKTSSFEELKQEIQEFLENAYAQNYFIPNRIIPKNQRSKWRFLVKGYLKELDKIVPDSTDYFEAVKLLTDLYQLICKACNIYLFSAEDPFRSIGWEQTDFFRLVTKKTLKLSDNRENVLKLFLMATSGGTSMEISYISLEKVLIEELKSDEGKRILLEEAKKQIEQKNEKLQELTKYREQYEIEEEIKHLCDLLLMAAIALGEVKDWISYYFKYYRQPLKEITLFCALGLANSLQDDKAWLLIYEYGMKKKIKPRESVVAEYKERCKV